MLPQEGLSWAAHGLSRSRDGLFAVVTATLFAVPDFHWDMAAMGPGQAFFLRMVWGWSFEPSTLPSRSFPGLSHPIQLYPLADLPLGFIFGDMLPVLTFVAKIHTKKSTHVSTKPFRVLLFCCLRKRTFCSPTSHSRRTGIKQSFSCKSCRV